jgi:hypothetical protein
MLRRYPDCPEAVAVRSCSAGNLVAASRAKRSSRESRRTAVSAYAAGAALVQCRLGLPLEVRDKVRERRSESGGVIFRRDARGNVVGADVHASPSVDRGELPGHGHGASVRGVFRDEVHGLYDPHARDKVDEARLDNVRVRGGLAPGGRSVRVGQP